MQYWKKLNSGQMEIIGEKTLKGHPEKIEWLKNNGYGRVMSKSDWSPYKEPKKSTAKKAVKKIKKKLKK